MRHRNFLMIHFSKPHVPMYYERLYANLMLRLPNPYAADAVSLIPSAESTRISVLSFGSLSVLSAL